MKTGFIRCKAGFCIVVITAILSLVHAWGQSSEQLDLQALTKLKAEAYNHSQAMETVSWLADVYGPPLSGSPSMQGAANYLEKRMKEFGLSNVHRETFPFGRSWANTRFYLHEISPQTFPLIGILTAFTGGTNGWVRGEAVLLEVDPHEINIEKNAAKYAGKLQGKFVLAPKPSFSFPAQPEGKLTAEDLARLENTPSLSGRRMTWGYQVPDEEMRRSRNEENKLAKWLLDQGVLAVIHSSAFGDYGTVFAEQREDVDPRSTLGVPDIVIAVEHYNRLVRQLQKNIPVTLELNAQVEAGNKMEDAINVIGEVPGTDKADEIVQLGGHYDAVFTGAGEGATDDLVGCATALEAVRLIQASGLKPRRTIRVACWSSEEQGPRNGSRAYVQAHFRDWYTGELKPEWAKLSAYYNLDNGAGAIRGVYMQANEAVAPIFSAWIQPLRNMGVSTLVVRGESGPDHASFDEVGLPGFAFIQDLLDYAVRTHHSNMDTYERIPPEDTIKNSIIMAFFAWQTANRDELLPRKPMPKPWREVQAQRSGSGRN
jgi:hypothetical protein